VAGTDASGHGPGSDQCFAVVKQEVAARREADPERVPGRRSKASEQTPSGIEERERPSAGPGGADRSGHHSGRRASPQSGRCRDRDTPTGPQLRHAVVGIGALAAAFDKAPARNLGDHLPSAASQLGVKPLKPQHAPRLGGREAEQARQPKHVPPQHAVAQPGRPALSLDRPAINWRGQVDAKHPVAAAVRFPELAGLRVPREHPDANSGASLLNDRARSG
jgi:hypothetical protein